MNCDPLGGKEGRKVKREECEDMNDVNEEIELSEELYDRIFEEV